jgi:hypothetical protein
MLNRSVVGVNYCHQCSLDETMIVKMRLMGL